MAKTHGKDARVYLNGLDISGVTNGWTVGMTPTADETTTYGSDWRTRLPGLGDWTAEVTGFFDDSAVEHDKQIEELIGASSVLGVFPTGTAETSYGYEGTPNTTDYSTVGPVDGPVTISHTYTGSGRLSRTMILSNCALTAEASQAGTARDIGAAGNAVGFCRATSFSSTTGDATLRIDHSSASDAGWTAYITFTAVSASGAETKVASTSASRWLRATHFVSGSDTAVNYLISAEAYD